MSFLGHITSTVCYKYGLLFSSDVDECKRNETICGHYCSNTNGSYVCSCMDGYTLSDNGHTCEGVICLLCSYMYMYIVSYVHSALYYRY